MPSPEFVEVCRFSFSWRRSRPLPPAEPTRAGRARPRRPDRRYFSSAGLSKDAPPLPAAGDETFIRRATLDLTGKLPEPEQVRDFVADATPDKRARLIDRLLQSDAYAVNWGRYWRDVVTYHTPGQRQLPPLETVRSMVDRPAGPQSALE